MGRSKPNLHELLRPLSAGRGRARTKQRSGAVNPDVQALWNIVAMIPPGLVMSYGEVARAAGLPGHARQAGYALRIGPSHLHLPWHRVVAAGGRIAFPKGSRGFREQVRLLRSEGVAVENGRVAPAALARL
jgi:methylated-DNA-protein-cysteine methyltransferase-like protein